MKCSFEEMVEMYPQYCEWVIQTREIEDETSPDLKHFADYLLLTGFGGRTHRMQELKRTTGIDTPVSLDTSEEEWEPTPTVDGVDHVN